MRSAASPRRIRPTILGKKLIVLLVLTAIFSSTITGKTYATIAPCHYSSGHLTYSTTADSIGNYYSSLSSAVYNWNASRSTHLCYNNISLTEITYGSQAVSVYVSTDTANTCVLGQVYLWLLVDGILYSPELDEGVVWQWADLYFYPSRTALAIQNNQSFTNSDLPACIIKTVAHEFGHLLALMHPAAGVVDPSIMRQGLSTIVSPTDYDRAEVHTKWCLN